MTNKIFKLKAEEIKPVAEGHGACFASDKITVEGLPVCYMYREAPDNDIDSGWRFLSGQESDEYMDNADNHAVYDVNTIANYDCSIIPFLSAPLGKSFERPDGKSAFVEITD